MDVCACVGPTYLSQTARSSLVCLSSNRRAGKTPRQARPRRPYRASRASQHLTNNDSEAAARLYGERGRGETKRNDRYLSTSSTRTRRPRRRASTRTRTTATWASRRLRCADLAPEQRRLPPCRISVTFLRSLKIHYSWRRRCCVEQTLRRWRGSEPDAERRRPEE